ncbi:transporter [Solidesulfovibrio sp. C21]|uniref:transporter n=1 Tax=Solidesulfovibrio sp. C21 TaxID=3398613 RepID=UPI0039FC77B1
MNKRLLLAILCLCLALPASAPAGTTNARDYVPLPPGTNIINLYYSHGFGNELYARDKKVSDNANLTTNMGILRPIHYMQLGPFTIDPQAVIPFGEVELNGERSSGVGDITFLSTIWFVNNMEQGYYFAYSPYFTIPSGPYHRESIVNLGSNRWSFKQELAVGKRLADKAWLELIANVEFYTNNIDAPDAENKPVTSSKDPLYGVEFHASYDLTKDFFVSGDYYFAYGAETTLDGARQNDRTCNHTVGASFFYMLNQHLQLMADYKLPVAVQNGIKTNSITLRLAYVF